MTRKEWRTCRDPRLMIRALKGVASKRKKVLYLCGGCRILWLLLFDHSSKKAIQVAECFADGLATDEELRHAYWMAEPLGLELPDVESRKKLVEMGVITEAESEGDDSEVSPGLWERLLVAANLAEHASNPTAFDRFNPEYYIDIVNWPSEWLVRCVFGKPFEPPIPIDPRWKTPEVLALAGEMYAARTFDQMPSLGDRLAEAGCHQHDIQKHCWSEHPHVRGCWVVDSLLGKS